MTTITTELLKLQYLHIKITELKITITSGLIDKFYHHAPYKANTPHKRIRSKGMRNAPKACHAKGELIQLQD